MLRSRGRSLRLESGLQLSVDVMALIFIMLHGAKSIRVSLAILPGGTERPLNQTVPGMHCCRRYGGAWINMAA